MIILTSADELFDLDALFGIKVITPESGKEVLVGLPDPASPNFVVLAFIRPGFKKSVLDTILEGIGTSALTADLREWTVFPDAEDYIQGDLGPEEPQPAAPVVPAPSAMVVTKSQVFRMKLGNDHPRTLLQLKGKVVRDVAFAEDGSVGITAEG